MSIETPGQVDFSPTEDHEENEIMIEQEENVTTRISPGPPKQKRVPGLGAGQGEILPGFFDPMTDEELKEWGLI